MNEENVQADAQSAAAEEVAPAVPAAQDSDANDSAPSAAVAAAVSDDTPTPEQARALFLARPDAAGCLTTEGWMHRDGTLRS